MFNNDFYPTPFDVIETMLTDINLTGKVVLEPSAGKGDIVQYLKAYNVKEVLACEVNKDLQSILAGKCRLIGEDFLQVTSDQISHVDLIVMNPPFSADDKHILHAYEIAPAGCVIISLCNYNTLKKDYSKTRKQLKSIIDTNGYAQELGSCFDTAERKTNVNVAMVRLTKPGAASNEFEGFFMEEEEEAQANGIMSYNLVRDIVNRYVGAVKIFDEHMEVGSRMHNLVSGFFDSEMSFTCNSKDMPVLRSDFKKDLQKNAWKWIFEKMKMEKYATKGLKEQINIFVEKQTEVPFTMRNIYKMLEIVVGTTSSRMDTAILEVFDNLTRHYHENRYNVEGWKTNSHYLMGQKFIYPGCCWQDQKWHKGESKIQTGYRSLESLEDLIKALCYITGKNNDHFESMETRCRNEYIVYKDGKCVPDEYYDFFVAKEFRSLDDVREYQSKHPGEYTIYQRPSYGEWFDWTFFEVKAFKKGTMHFKFKDINVWAQLNQHIARIKGYPLPEAIKKAA